MIKNVEAIEKALKLEGGSLQKAIDSDESVDVSMPELVIRTKDEDDTRFTNAVNDAKSEAKIAGLEIAIKGVRNDLGLDFEGKTMDNLVKAIQDKTLTEAKIEPEAKVKELQGDLEQSKKNTIEWQGKFEGLEGTMQSERNQRTIDTQILKHIPSTGTSLEKDRIMLLFKAENELKLEEGKVLSMSNGEVMKDTTTLEPINIESRVKDFSAQFTKAPDGGTGGGDTPGQGGEGSLDAFTKRMEGEGISAGSSEFNNRMQAAMKDGTLKV